MSAWVLDFQGLGAGEEVDEKGIGGEKGRNEALMKACDGCGTSENWPLQRTVTWWWSITEAEKENTKIS